MDTKKIISVFIAAGVCIMIACALYVLFLFKELPDPALFDQRRIAQSTKIYDRTGAILLYELYNEQKRTILQPEEIPLLARQATIAIEDKNFYAHAAVDWKSIMRALIVNIRSASVAQGGSTITQQLAKNAFLNPDRTITRKIKELILAYRLEQRYTKDEIINLYLNQIPYGANSYGIEAAAQQYFGKNARNCTPAEIALLVSLPKAPSYYSPWGTHRDELMTRKDRALEQMAASGIITTQEKTAAQKEKIIFIPQLINIKAPHFVMMVQEYLINAYGDSLVRTGGLKVITTLDWNLQQRAEKAVADGAARNTELYKGTNAALVAEDSATGNILALVGSRNYFDTKIDGNFNVAAQGLRQPGSALKPFAYLTAFIKGFTPDTVLFDLETEFDATGDPERSYKPQNFDEEFRGPVTMRNALAQSINVPSVKTLYLAGIDATLATAHTMGITTLNERSRYGLSLALGGGEVKLIDIVHAYSVFSQDGARHRQSFILKIENDKGKILEQYADEKEQVLPPNAIRLTNDILSDADARAPLFHNSINLTIFPNQEVALKTGTTNDYRDAWAIGYTPSLVVGVWAGNNDNTPMQKKGGSILAAVPLWNAFMKDALKNYPLELFPRPEPIITDKPMLNNQYAINNEIHSILYYVDKKNPLGDPPAHPDQDPQFQNWEKPVIDWAQKNPTALLQQSVQNTASSSIAIAIQTPHNGDFIVSPIPLAATIIGMHELRAIELYLNDILIQRHIITPNVKMYAYAAEITALLETQNKITIKAFDAMNTMESKDLIIFKKNN